MNNVARIETEESLIKAVESLNIESVKELLSRFSFNQEVLKELTIQVVDKDLDLAELLIKNTEKTIKKLAILEIADNDKLLSKKLEERVDL